VVLAQLQIEGREEKRREESADRSVGRRARGCTDCLICPKLGEEKEEEAIAHFNRL
jgi:hypothetical protein